MRTESRELLAVGIFGGKSRIGDRIEMLLRRGRTFSTRASATGIATSALALSGLLIAGSLAPRWIAFAQQTLRPSFDVASVKLNIDGGSGGEFTPRFGGKLTIRNIPLSMIVRVAYGDILYYQLFGPGWIDSERFDIEARAESSPSEAEILLMLQNLLEERFKLRFHRETRELPVFTLTAARGGIKLKPWKEGSCVTFDRFNPPAAPPRGEEPPKHCGDNRTATKGLNAEWNANRIDMSGVTKALSSLLGRTVVDKTGFAGAFDIHLEWTPDPDKANHPDPGGPDRALADTSGPSIFTVLQEQLGLKLESAKGPVEVLVIDHVEKPDAN